MLREPIIDVKHRVFCGPKAIATLTGVPVSRIEKMYRRCRLGWSKDSRGRNRPIKSTSISETIKVLKRLGCKVEKLSIVEPTLGTFLKDTEHLGAPCLVNVTRHWAVTHRGECSDGTGDKTRVYSAWKVTAPEQPKYTTGAERKPRPKKERDLPAERYAAIQASIKKWESKRKRAETALKKLRRKARYYERKGESGAGGEDRTRDPNLGKVVLYL